MASAWGASWWRAWGNAWGGWTAEVEEVLVYYGGWHRASSGRRETKTDVLTEEIVRQQWDLLETRLRNRHDKHDGQERQAHDETAHAAEVVAGASDIDVCLSMPVPQVAARQDTTEDDVHAARIEARNRRNQEALLLIISQV